MFLLRDEAMAAEMITSDFRTQIYLSTTYKFKCVNQIQLSDNEYIQTLGVNVKLVNVKKDEQEGGANFPLMLAFIGNSNLGMTILKSISNSEYFYEVKHQFFSS